MDQEAFLFFNYIIMNNYVSVMNIPQGTTYIVTTADEEQGNILNLTVTYSHSDANNVYITYKLYLYDDVVSEMSRPLIDNGKRQPIDIKRMETLLQTCSAKIIAQEKQAQQNHMLKALYYKNSMEKN